MSAPVGSRKGGGGGGRVGGGGGGGGGGRGAGGGGRVVKVELINSVGRVASLRRA